MFRIISLVILIGCQFSQYCYAREAGANNIFVSILPQKYFVERIAGEHVKVSVMVGNGQNPATYEPTPKQMALLDKAQLYFKIGVPLTGMRHLGILLVRGLSRLPFPAANIKAFINHS